ncbi:hypothetical protein [Rubrolithibacter danxiaensis]|uniref:hypothetical protein n=1 Tax=Rubrolithibacter danxiaensis TaxID=3390805 RepID=UPI003BF8EB95
MTLYEFISLNTADKANAVWNGTFIGNREDTAFKYQLYCIDEFFVEVKYDAEENKIVGFKPFKSRKLIDVYLNNISISDMYK